MHTGEQTTILKCDASGRVTVTRAQREALTDEFERSELKGLPFAQIAGGNYQAENAEHDHGGIATMAALRS